MRLQPNFSWQKYEGLQETEDEQFQYQLQSEHILVANSINSTISDLCYYTQERPTSFTWIDGKQIYTKTITGKITTAPGTTTIAHGIVGINQVINFTGSMQDQLPLSGIANPLPFLDLTVFANSVETQLTGTNLLIITNGAFFLNYLIQVNLSYTKTS